MKILDEALGEFVRIYREEFGEDLSRGDAEEMARKVVTLYELLTKNLPN